METPRRTSRAEWQQRIERWRDSGLGADQFAAELGINAGTLRYWKYQLEKDARRALPGREEVPSVGGRDFVEMRQPLVAAVTGAPMFELELTAGRKLRIPAVFDAEALERLLSVMERR